MSKARINPEMLRWARERASLSVDQFSNKLQIRVDRLQNWEKGEDFPTFKQAEKIAQKTRIPLGYLYLSAPPTEEKLSIPDLRSYSNSLPEQPSTDFFDLIRDVMFQHDWYRDYLRQQGAESLSFVNKFKLDDNVQDIAEDIRTTLKMVFPPISSKWEDHFRHLCEQCEDVGIWIMRSGYIGSDTHRTLNVHEFRGFAISDPIVPLIFINGRDAKAAQFFTLAHELAHIWLGESGISNSRLDENPNGEQVRVEKVCNAVAAEMLVPKSIFLDHWQQRNGLDDNIFTLSKFFKVSGIVIARRAVTLDKITQADYHRYFEQEQKLWDKKSNEKSSGGNYYATMPIKNGHRFTEAVLLSAMSDKLLLRDAGGLLHMKPSTLQKLFRKLQKD